MQYLPQTGRNIYSNYGFRKDDLPFSKKAIKRSRTLRVFFGAVRFLGTILKIMAVYSAPSYYYGIRIDLNLVRTEL